MSRRRTIAAVLALLGVVGLSTSARAIDDFVTIGTGALTGLYYPAGRAICRFANHVRGQTGMICSVEASPGSIYNIEKVTSGEIEFGIVQSDVQFAAVKGLGEWQGHPVSELRSVMSLHPELFAIVARRSAGIHDLAGLKGRKVNVGNLGSGTRATWEALAVPLGWAPDAIKMSELPAAAANEGFCDGTLDAVMITAGHPSPQVEKLIKDCDGMLVPVEGPAVDQLVSTSPYYVKDVIRRSAYGGGGDVPTFGGRATLVTTTAVDDDTVAALVTAVMGHLEELRQANRTLADLDPKQMQSVGLTAPLHPGAVRAYRDLGLGN